MIKSISEARNYYYVCEELNDKIKGLKQKLIDERNEEVIKLYNEGFIPHHISKELNIPSTTVYRYIKKYKNQQANIEVS